MFLTFVVHCDENKLADFVYQAAMGKANTPATVEPATGNAHGSQQTRCEKMFGSFGDSVDS